MRSDEMPLLRAGTAGRSTLSRKSTRGPKDRAALQPHRSDSDTLAGGRQHVERKTISIMKACELVGVSRRTIYNWLSSGKIEYVRTAGGSVRIFVDTLWRDPHHADRPATDAVWQQERNQA